MTSSTVSKSPLEHFNQDAASYEAGTGGCTRELARCILDLMPNMGDNSVDTEPALLPPKSC